MKTGTQIQHSKEIRQGRLKHLIFQLQQYVQVLTHQQILADKIYTTKEVSIHTVKFQLAEEKNPQTNLILLTTFHVDNKIEVDRTMINNQNQH